MLDNVTLEKHLKKFQLVANTFSLLIGLLTALGVCYGFYYKTNEKLDIHEEKIVSIETNIASMNETLNNTAVFQGASKEQIKALENQVTDIKKGQDRIEDKLDRLIMQKN